MSGLLNQYRADFIEMADTILKTPGVPKKVFAHSLNCRFIIPLRQQNVDEGVIAELRDEAFRIFESRRAISKNRQARKQQAPPYKQARGNKNTEIVRYEEPNEIPRTNGVRR